MRVSTWVAVIAGAATLATSIPASAQVFRPDTSVRTGASPLLIDAQFQGGARRFPHGGVGSHGTNYARGGLANVGGGHHGGGFGNRGGFGNPGFAGNGYRHGRGGFGVGAGLAGLAAGAVIGGAIASQADPGYGYGYGYAPGYAPAPVYDPGYAPDYGYAAPPPVETADAGSEQAYCSQRFKSYDPSSGTYLGYDGARHPCP